MNASERPMRVATVRVLGAFLTVLALGLAVDRVSVIIGWKFVLTLEQEALQTAVVAVFSALALVAGLRMLRAPAPGTRRVMTIAVLALTIPLAFGMRGLEPSSGAMSGREREAFDYLRTAEQFEMRSVGFGGNRSRGYLAMRILQRSAAAADAFEELTVVGTMPGQLYGLCGLRETRPALYARLLPRYRASKESVPVVLGCTVVGVDVATFARKMPPHTFTRPDPNEAEALADERAADFQP